MSLVFIASAYDNTNVILAKHAHKVEHGLLVGPLGGYVFVLAFQSRVHKTSVNVVVGACCSLKYYTILVVFIKIKIVLFELVYVIKGLILTRHDVPVAVLFAVAFSFAFVCALGFVHSNLVSEIFQLLEYKKNSLMAFCKTLLILAKSFQIFAHV